MTPDLIEEFKKILENPDLIQGNENHKYRFDLLERVILSKNNINKSYVKKLEIYQVANEIDRLHRINTDPAIIKDYINKL